MKKPVLTLEEHKEIAASMACIRNELLWIFKKMQPIAVTGKVSKTCHKTLKQIDELRCQLDNAFHAIISDEAFKDLGHIYYPHKK